MGLDGTKALGKKVLSADDDPVTRSLLGQCLKSDGFAVLAAADGIEACSVAQAEKPDLALLDLLLPRRDGYSVLLHLRSREMTRETPIIILSAETAEEHAGIARTLGAQGFMTKPFEPSALLATVRQVLDNKGKR